ncbi:uncharacterized protein LOC123298115 isoform X2 [Chrysoperla carnea]|nr:uncharacterized protein LOC123298115 isoform X2 [Chrysoperla carnea]
MKNNFVIGLINVIFYCAFFTNNSNAQRITTIQLEGTQYFISKMNPYAPALNYYLAYQYCRSIGLQLVSFETMEKTKAMSNYLKNAGYTTTDYWTAGNKLGTNMLIWMSTGLPFNSTFNMMRNQKQERSFSARLGGRSVESAPGANCVALTKPLMEWDVFDCMATKDFICEQTRCYYYNYGAIPVTASQG